MNIKTLVKSIWKYVPIALTKNQKYDKQSKSILHRVLRENSNCIDIGCHKGEILDIMLSVAPKGKHYGFEPIPKMYEYLTEKYKEHENCKILNVALSNQKGVQSFNYVVSNPSYSGLKKRKYDRSGEHDTSIQVKTDLLDNVLPDQFKVDLLKIDVEGAELWVLEGAKETIKRNQPFIIFEHGLGSSEFYDSSPEQVFSFFDQLEMSISNLDSFLKGKAALKEGEFKRQYDTGENYYFIAHPIKV